MSSSTWFINATRLYNGELNISYSEVHISNLHVMSEFTIHSNNTVDSCGIESMTYLLFIPCKDILKETYAITVNGQYLIIV